MEYVGVSMDLGPSLKEHAETLGTRAAYVRALSFAMPSKTAMDDWAKKWRNLADEAGRNAIKPEDYLFDDEDDDDDDDEEWDPEMLAAASQAVAKDGEIVSPFDPNAKSADSTTTNSEAIELELSVVNVDKASSTFQI